MKRGIWEGSAHLLWERRGEKEGLPALVLGHVLLLHDAANVGLEPLVKEAVGLVDHEEPFFEKRRVSGSNTQK